MSKDSNVLPAFIMKDAVAVSDKMEMLNCFNEHFILSGSLFENSCSQTNAIMSTFQSGSGRRTVIVN